MVKCLQVKGHLSIMQYAHILVTSSPQDSYHATGSLYSVLEWNTGLKYFDLKAVADWPSLIQVKGHLSIPFQ